ncbi:MAG TPA: hypothetical protein ENK18_08675 [Deltaproteobacteria bacterium]|nr:hypothetical protein [Deltaproteobacteria bacterium]
MGAITVRSQHNREIEVDETLWNAAKAKAEARPSGRLVAEDAQALFELIASDGEYSDLEKRTVKHLRTHFRWTPAGDTAFRTAIRAAASRGWGGAEEEVLTTTITTANGREVVVDSRLWSEAIARTEGKNDGVLGKADAAVLFDLVAEDGQYSDLEKLTIKHIRKNFKWTEKGDEQFRAAVRAAVRNGWTQAEVDDALSD